MDATTSSDARVLEDAAATAAALRLRDPQHRVSRRAIGYWSLRAGLGWLIPLAVEIVWLVADLDNLVTHVIWLAVTVVVAALHVGIMPQWRYRVHRWETTPQAVYTQSGWLNQSRRIAPVSRIQTVDTERGPFEQLLGLSNITVTTASAAGPLKIEGLDHETAQRLVDELTTTTQANPGDAT
ncbi:PH domain-containing protein [Rugosimonospora africana]|uniref:Membrane protein n=1 Tax=Rugosimonospora africana TaxID=556532 RepID=A0A8J3QTY8_9ACTN|nr:PH domain-containing protein [Rugosimonospora africana]GIH16499.1 membrane protein [Rugosimonospora africana]